MNSVSKSGKSARVGGLQLNRFSSFFRAGGEHYLLGKADATVRKSDQVDYPGVGYSCFLIYFFRF